MASLLYRFGTGIRETGQALQKLGASLEGNYSFREQCTSLSLSLSDHSPLLPPAACRVFPPAYDERRPFARSLQHPSHPLTD
jgi:hypothetical protein